MAITSAIVLYAVIGFVLRRADRCAQRAAVLLGCGLQIGDGNGDVIQAADHRFSSPAA